MVPVDVDVTLRVGLVAVGPGEVFDPLSVAATNPSAMIALDLVSDALSEWPGGAGSSEPAQPAIAESITPDDANTLWTVALDPDRTFSDGSPITADDVVFSLDRVKASGASNLAGARLDVVEAIEAVDATTVKITMTSPFVQLPELLASPLLGIVSKAAITADPSTTVGSGPYTPASTSAGDASMDAASSGTTVGGDDAAVVTTMTLRRAPGGAGEWLSPDVVELVPFDGVAESYDAFSSGELDWSLVPNDAEGPASDVGTLVMAPAGVVGWLGINAADPVYGDARFRQAIARAVQRDAIVDETVPNGVALEAIVADGVPGHVPDPCGDVCDVTSSGDAARALLAEAFPDGAIPTVTLNGYDDPDQRALLDHLEGDLEAVGIPVEQRLEPPDSYEAFVVSGQQGVFSLGTVGIVPMQDSYVGSSFLSDSWDNATGIRSDTLDAQIREARAATDVGERENLYRSVETQVLAQYAQIPLYQLQVRQAVGARVSDFETRLDGTIVLTQLSITS